MSQEALDTLNERRASLQEQEALGAKAVVALQQLYDADPSGSLDNAQALFVACSLFLGADPALASITATRLNTKLQTTSINDWYADIQARLEELDAAIASLKGN